MKALSVADRVNESCDNLVEAIAGWNAGSREAIETCREQLERAAGSLADAQAATIACPESARNAVACLTRIRELAENLQSRADLAKRMLSQRCGLGDESSLFYEPGGQKETIALPGSGMREGLRIEA